MNFVIPTDRKFLGEYRNGASFSIDPTTDFTTYMQCDTIENSRLDATYQVYTITEASTTSEIQFYADLGYYVMKLPTSNWGDEGFVVGNTIRLESGGLFKNASVVNIIGNLMYVEAGATNLLTFFSFADFDYQSDLTIKNTTVPTALIFRFGLIPNSLPSNNFFSLLDGQEQVYSSNAIDGTYSSLNYLATESSNLGGVECKWDSTTGTGNYIFTFTVRHTFRFPHSIEAWNSAYTGGGVPASFSGTNSYRYLSQLQFANNILDPNDRKQFTDGFQLGSVGFKSQNFNSGTSNYNLVSLTYTTGEAPEVTGLTSVNAQIQKTDGNFTAGVKGIVYHSKLPSSAEYSENDNTYAVNYVLDSIANTEGSLEVDSDIITAFEFSINGGDASLIDVNFELSYSAAQQIKMPNLTWLFLGFTIEDESLDAAFSDRVLVELDSVQVVKDSDVTGLATDFNATFREPTSAYSATNGKVWNNRLMTCEFDFDLTKFSTDDYNFLSNLRYNLVGYDGTDYFSLDTYTIPMGFVPVLEVGGAIYQVINLDTERFLAVGEGSSLREVQLTMAAPGTFAATQEVSGKFGFTIPWAQWKSNTDVPMIFYDGALPDEFFNRNKRTSNYSGLESFDIYVFLTASLNNNGLNTDYIFYSDAFNVYDFDLDGAATGWTTTSFKIFNADGEETTDLTSGEQNRIEFILANPTMTGITQQGSIAELVTEPVNNLGREWRLHSDEDWSEADNPLSPESGEAGVKIDLDLIGNTVTISCLCDGALIDSVVNHNFYVHFYE